MDISFVILGQFCHFSLIKAWNIEFEKTRKKMPGDIILHLRHKNHYFIDDVRFLRYRALQTETFVILVHFMFSLHIMQESFLDWLIAFINIYINKMHLILRLS